MLHLVSAWSLVKFDACDIRLGIKVWTWVGFLLTLGSGVPCREKLTQLSYSSLLETAVAPLLSPGLPYSGGSLESFVVLASNSSFQRGPWLGLAARDSSSGQLLFWTLAAHSSFE